MIKHMMMCGAGAFSLAAAAVPAFAADQAKSTAASSVKPQLGQWGVDLAGMDKSRCPGPRSTASSRSARTWPILPA
jgi:hypothetical protein